MFRKYHTNKPLPSRCSEYIEVNGERYLAEFVRQDELAREKAELMKLKLGLWFVVFFSTVTLLFLWVQMIPNIVDNVFSPSKQEIINNGNRY